MSKWKTTDSGLKYEVLKETTGEVPQLGQTVNMHYELWSGEGVTTSNYDYDNKEYLDSIYDSTYDEANPFSGPIEITIGQRTPKDEVYTKGESIDGLDEALLGMRVGEKRALLIPSSLGYGPEGGSSFHTFHGYRTPPNKQIRCNIELTSIKEEEPTTVKNSIEAQPENVAYEG